jgi:hypothetical protein
MSYPRGRARALGLALMVVLGLMALGASGAQGNWLILHNGQTVQNEVNVPIALSAHTHITYLVADAFKTEILCTTASADDLLLFPLSTLALGITLVSGCTTFQSGKASPNCNPINQPIAFQEIWHLVLHNGKNYLLVKNEKPATFEFGELCALGEEIVETGSLGFECGHLSAGVFVGLDCKNHQVTQLLRPVVPQSLLGDSLKWGANTVTVDGILAWKIDGGLYLGDAWGGHI